MDSGDMKYPRTRQAVFLDRPNRFVAHVQLDGAVETVHVKNTGRCRELLLPGASVIVSESDAPNRKTKYDLVTVWKDSLGWVNVDSQAPNRLVKEWLECGPAAFPGLTVIRPEYTWGASRIDFCLECGSRRILLEVKGCTLEREGVGYFPDAPTKRGTKHLHELTAALKEGFDCCIAFVIAMPGVQTVLPNAATDPAFATALAEAEKTGVQVMYLPCRVGENEISIIP